MLRAAHAQIAASTAVVTYPGMKDGDCHVKQKGDLAEMGNDDALLSREVNRLYNIVNRHDKGKLI